MLLYDVPLKVDVKPAGSGIERKLSSSFAWTKIVQPVLDPFKVVVAKVVPVFVCQFDEFISDIATFAFAGEILITDSKDPNSPAAMTVRKCLDSLNGENGERIRLQFYLKKFNFLTANVS
jgi:hypothetical protein